MGKLPDLPKMPFGQQQNQVVDDCDRPACDDVVGAMTAALGRVQNQQKAQVECPPNSPELGRSSWTLLHSMVRWCHFWSGFWSHHDFHHCFLTTLPAPP